MFPLLMQKTGFLWQSYRLLSITRLDQRQYTAPVPKSFHHENLSADELDNDGCSGSLHHMDGILQHLCLHPRASFLGPREGS
jgi:hypothetical protein